MDNLLSVTSNKLSEACELKVPGDKREEYIAKNGDLIQKVSTQNANMTARTYSKKNGEKGKSVVIIKQPNH